MAIIQIDATVIPRILELTPKDVKKFGISRQTLWNIKQKITKHYYHQISLKIKVALLNYLEKAP